MRRAVPFILSVDVEPDGFQLAREPARSTNGAEALVDLVGTLRPRLERSTGHSPSFGWFFRMDPQIEAAYGRADHLVSAIDGALPDVVAAGDHLGLHTHPLRWDEGQQQWVHDVSDPQWTAHVIDSSFAAFERRFGTACERHRMGAALFSQDIVDALTRAGTRVESALEPVRGAAADGRMVETGVDSSPMSGRAADCATAPRRPYWPRPGDFLGDGGPRDGMVLLPLTTTWLWPGRSAWRTAAANAIKWRRRPPARVLYLGDRRSPVEYWNLVVRQLRRMRRPFVNVAIRTDAPGTTYFERACRILEALPSHALASHIEVVDPLTAASRLLGEPEPVRAA